MNAKSSQSTKGHGEELLGLLRSARVIPVLTIERVADAVPLGRALVAGGVRVLEINLRTEAAIDAAIMGVGITRVLSYQCAAAERAGTLVRVLRAYESTPTPVNLVYGGQPPLPLKLRAFIDFAAPRLKASLAGPSSL